MKKIRNIFACLVHESQECVIDLVRNLHCFDPSSLILLYNGGNDRHLLDHSFPFECYGAELHPRPRLLTWGRLHDFALDCMQFALDHFTFDTLTIVDSDQLAIRTGYSHYLSQFLADQSDIGLLGNSPLPHPPDTPIGPARAAFEEIDLWQPFFQRFPEGEKKFVHWSFWPSTVFTVEAARDLTKLFATDAQLQDMMCRTKIWATEEVIFPTLVALLGYKIASNPCCYDYVQYGTRYDIQQIDTALTKPDVFWIHPVSRCYHDGLRKYIRERFNHYEKSALGEGTMTTPGTNTNSGLLLTLPILAQMKKIEGWLEEDEADLLMAATLQILTRLPKPYAVVEVGSYCGRSTIMLGSVVKALCPQAKVYAIDPHDGKVGALDQGIRVGPPTLEIFKRNIADAGLSTVVELIPKHSFEVHWEKPIGLLFIDGLHDYANVAQDFFHLAPWVVAGGYIAFHDYADYYPGVKALVNEILTSGRYREVHRIQSMMIIEKLSVEKASRDAEPNEQQSYQRMRAMPIFSSDATTARIQCPTVLSHRPMVSCIMPTFNRRAFLPQAIRYFLRQDYPNCELIVVDDGIDAIADLIPPDPRIRYLQLKGKHTLGAKRNLACENAGGKIIVHWDDDDWMANWRLSYQVFNLLEQQADICGLDRVLYYDADSNQSWQYIYPKAYRPWVAGNTLCYAKRVWSDNLFPEIDVGEDNCFLWSSHARKIVALQDDTFYVALIHPGNTSPKRTQDACWHSYPTGEIRGLMGEDWRFYDNLRESR